MQWFSQKKSGHSCTKMVPNPSQDTVHWHTHVHTFSLTFLSLWGLPKTYYPAPNPKQNSMLNSKPCLNESTTCPHFANRMQILVQSPINVLRGKKTFNKRRQKCILTWKRKQVCWERASGFFLFWCWKLVTGREGTRLKLGDNSMMHIFNPAFMSQSSKCTTLHTTTTNSTSYPIKGSSTLEAQHQLCL